MTLKNKIIKGGKFLIARQLISTILSIISLLLVSREIGPEAYGIYAVSLTITLFAFQISQLGINVYLLRSENALTNEDYDNAFSLLLIVSSIIIINVNVFSDYLAIIFNSSYVGTVLKIMLTVMTLQLLSITALTKIERDLNYKTITLIELIGQLLFVLVAVPLAILGKGVWAPLLGWITQQTISFIFLYKTANYKPKLRWDTKKIRAMLQYSLGYSMSIWVWLLRLLVSPLIVVRYAGVEVAGIVALTIRLTDMLMFVKSSTWRLSIVALSKIQSNKIKIMEVVEHGMHLQVLAAAPLLLLFSLINPWLINAFFGSAWSDVINIFPFIAIGVLINSAFALHSSALYVLKYNWSVTIFHIVHISLFAGSAWLLVPELGLLGYGIAEIIAIISYVFIHTSTVKHVGKPAYGIMLWWVVTFSFALLWNYIGIVAFLPMAIIFIIPQTYKTLNKYFIYIAR